jgi:NAD(P)-dependent dehydrogenase (short-subunit alcohol dehydrogenase family)
MKCKTVVITGGTSGIGESAAIKLAQLGAQGTREGDIGAALDGCRYQQRAAVQSDQTMPGLHSPENKCPLVDRSGRRQLRQRRTRRALREPVSVNNRTGLRSTDMEIGK